MIERVVENWLDNSNETSFQVPFCHILASKGFTVLHLTRHCGMELGKDVIALDPNGTPCAFQLKSPKGKRITLHDWRKGINAQVHDLVTLRLIHPSLPAHKHHRSFLVTNGGIDEEVHCAIDEMNRQWKESGQEHLRLETIVGGELYKDALDLGTNLWPSELGEVKTLLEMFLLDGRCQLPKKKLAELLCATLPLQENAKRPPQAKSIRACSSAALLCAIAITNFTKKGNYVAEIEAWVMYVSHVLASAERWKLPKKKWLNSFQIGISAISNLLESLMDELRARSHLVEGDFATDPPFRQVRITYLLALVGIHVLWRLSRDALDDETDAFAKEFCQKHQKQILMWGEAAIPQILAFYWYWKRVDPTPEIHFMLSALIEEISRANAPKSDPAKAIANPYYCAEEVFAEALSVKDEPREEDFRRNSYSLEALVHLFVRQNWKQHMKQLWPDVTRVWFNRFEPTGKWRFFLWRTDKGKHWSVCPTFPKRWNELCSEAREAQGKRIPALIKTWPVFLLLFLCVYPHRLTAEIVRWLDTRLGEI